MAVFEINNNNSMETKKKYKFIDYAKFQARFKSFVQIFEKHGLTTNQDHFTEMDRLVKQGQIELILGRYLENVIFNFALNESERSGGEHNSLVSKFLKHCFEH